MSAEINSAVVLSFWMASSSWLTQSYPLSRQAVRGRANSSIYYAAIPRQYSIFSICSPVTVKQPVLTLPSVNIWVKDRIINCVLESWQDPSSGWFSVKTLLISHTCFFFFFLHLLYFFVILCLLSVARFLLSSVLVECLLLSAASFTFHHSVSDDSSLSIFS